MALIRKANPDLTWRDVKLILAASARKNHPSHSGWSTGARRYGTDVDTDIYSFNHDYGFGVVDAAAAVELAGDWTLLPPYLESATTLVDDDLPVPDAVSGGVAGAVVTSTVTAGSDIEFIEFVEVEATFDAPAFRDLRVELVSPAGRVSEISVPHAPSPAGFGSGAFRFGSARHLGESMAGDWTLRLSDHQRRTPARPATLQSWRLTFYGHTDSIVPTLATAAVNLATLALTYSEALDADSLPDAGQFTVSVAGSTRSLASQNAVAVSGKTVTLTLASAVTSGQAVTVSYAVPATNPIQDVAGNAAAALTNESVTNETAVPPAAPHTLQAAGAGRNYVGVSWTAPADNGSAITDYDVRYHAGTTDPTDRPTGSTRATTARIRRPRRRRTFPRARPIGSRCARSTPAARALGRRASR